MIQLNKILLSLSVVYTSLLITGCNNTSNVEIPKYNFPKSTNIQKNEDNIILSNGMLVLKNGERIIDSAGNIENYFTIDDKLFYIINCNNQEFIIKSKDNNIVEKLVANKLVVFKDNNEIFIATKEKITQKFKPDIFENVYSFDGKKLGLINKNLDLSDAKINDNYFIKRHYYRLSNLNMSDIVITDIKTNSNINLNAKFNPGAKAYPMGIVNNNIFYIYGTGNLINSKRILEVFNTKTNTTSTLFVGNDEKFQLFKNNNNVILKVFNDKNVKRETKLAEHISNPKSEYENISAKYISLNTLEEVNDSSNYRLTPILTYYKNSGGESVPLTIVTFELNDVFQFITESENLLF